MSSSNVSILIVEKTGNIKEQVIKFTNENELYKKAGFKTNADFKSYAEWNIDNLNDKQYCIRVYGKTKGQANQENKYEFPPPVDTVLFFGSCVIMNFSDNIPKNLVSSEWDAIYEHLFGGFEDIDEEDAFDEEDDIDDDLPKTKFGYAKDGFVVDDDETEEEEDEVEEETEEEEEIEDDTYVSKKKPKKAKSAPPKRKNSLSKPGKKQPEQRVANDLTVLDCTNELSEEEYF